MRLYVDELAAFFSSGENHDTVDKGEEGVVFTHTYVEARMMLSAALALDDVAGFALRSTEDFHA